jgi:hypothetical protein
LIRDNTTEKIVIDPSSAIKGSVTPTAQTSVLSDYSDTTFDYQYQLDQSVFAQTKLMLIRPLNSDSSIGLQTTSPFGACSVNLPIQGKTVTSTANTTSGVTRKIELFQSYPQIPADFFITSF